jgi:hypothetical protein
MYVTEKYAIRQSIINNMNNRIEIDGVWYTREDNTTPEVIPQLEPSVSYEGLVFESDLYCFEATRLRDDTGNFYDKECSIKFTDKSKYSGLGDVEIGEIWDNADWMRGIIENEVEAIEEAMESLCSQGFAELKEVLTTLRVAAWI